MAKSFISDSEMEKLEASQPKKKSFISDEEMSALEQSDPSKESSFDIMNPMSSALKKSVEIGAKGLGAVGEFVDRYTGAPTRAGLLAGIKEKSVPAGLIAAKQQFGEDVSMAPTGEQILEQTTSMEPGFARSAAGFGVDVLADPLNLIPVTKIAGLKKGASLLEKAPKSLMELAESKAIKQSGGMLKDFRRLLGKEKMSEVGQAILKTKVDIPDDAGKIKKVPIFKVGDDVEDIAEKASIAREQLGQKIGNIYQQIDDKFTDTDFLSTLDQKSLKKLSETKRFNPIDDVAEIRAKLDEKYSKKVGGKQALARVQSILDDMSQRSNSLSDALSLKNEIDDMINYSKQTQDLPDYQRALVDVRNYIRDKTNKYVESVGDILKVENAKELKDLNKQFGAIAEVSQFSSDRVAREMANRMFSPSDYLSGAAGGIALGPQGLLLAGANKGLREYGPGLISRGSERASKMFSPVSGFGAEALRGVTELDRPIVRGLLKKAKKDEKEKAQ